MTKAKFKELENVKNSKIRVENRQIKKITLIGGGHYGQAATEVQVDLEPANGEPTMFYDYFKFPLKRLNEFLSIFAWDKDTNFEDLWRLDEFDGKYVRLCWYVTPPEEEHQLSDPEYLYAVRHITKNNDHCLFVIEGDGK